MPTTYRPNFPARPFGQILGPMQFASRVFGYPVAPKPDRRGFIQVDGYQTVVAGVEDYESRFGPYIQVDGYQTVVAGFETYSAPFENHVQVDGLQVVIIVVET